MRRAIVISAHPDDMEIGMGGTVARMVATGIKVTSVVLTDGRRSSNPFGWSENEMAEVRKSEVSRAATVLGISELICLGLPDLRSENYHEAVRQLASVVENKAPVEVYTSHSDLDRHPTHRLAGQVVQEAMNMVQLAEPPTLWAYEVWGLFPEWDRIEYIDEQVGKKILAIAEHKSQVSTIPYSEGVIGLNRWRATFADPHETAPQGVFAEVFVSIQL